MHNQSSSSAIPPTLPRILAGPILRDVTPDYVVLWLVSSVEASFEVSIWSGEKCLQHAKFAPTGDHVMRVGQYAWIHRLVVKASSPLPTDTWLGYDINCEFSNPEHTREALMSEELIDICYPGANRPQFVVPSQIRELLHGSCRKPHHLGEDGLCTVDEQLAKLRANGLEQPELQPALLMMSGDQVYVDDVAGPMLFAVRQVIELLGLYQEPLEGADISHAAQLDNHPSAYYKRSQLLPDNTANNTLRERFFGGARKPIFTTQNADNHLISLSEVLAMYFLVWSPVLWRYLSLEMPKQIDTNKQRYQLEKQAIEAFVVGLPQVRRAMANIPVYMIFDDHDITDDWNLSRSWEESAYEHPFSRRIIGNALVAYALCQAWGNRLDSLPPDLINDIREMVQDPKGENVHHDQLITQLLTFEGWSFVLDTKPKVVVLDTRTRRWRAESNGSNPSGLMDWEALSETQQHLINEPAVILVSPAPIFGVKLIEVIQRLFSWAGLSLMVDAENWMAHPGSANVILNIFRHKRTPDYFTILSGDVHYSFVYDVRLRHHNDAPRIWQITSSGILNRFPARLLKVFDLFNRWLFASRSPLNWLTRRRHMRIRPRRPTQYPGRYPNQRLVNACGIGRVVFDENGAPSRIEQIFSGGRQVGFEQGYDSEWEQ